MKFFAMLSFVIFTVGHVAMAQNSANSTAIDSTSLNSTPINTSTTSFRTPSDLLKGSTLLMGAKSYNDTGRVYETQTPGGRDFKSKSEFFLGGRLPSGFGIFGQVVEYVNTYNNGVKSPVKTNGVNPGDPSLTLLHPIYANDHLIVNGALREYFPVTDRGLSKNIYQQAYYLNVLYKMKNRVDFFNQLIPRYFTQTLYSPTDSLLYVEDYTSLTHRVNDWFRFGGGVHTMVDVHSGTPTGSAAEVYPFADFMISNSVYAGPRLYMPIAAQNSVYDGPVAVSSNNFQAEIYLQATL